MTTGDSNSGYLSNTETLSIGDNSDPPNYPDHSRRIEAATGGFLHQDFVTCGGYIYNEGFTNKCYLLGSEEPFATIMTKRAFAASIVLEPGKLWILGGWDGSIISSSTVYIFSDGRYEEGPLMPIALYYHAMVKINDTTSILVGGLTSDSDYSKRTWYNDGKWLDGPDLEKARYKHSVGIIRDPFTDKIYIVAAGGSKGHGTDSYINDVEILDLQENKWETGMLSFVTLIKLKFNLKVFS